MSSPSLNPDVKHPLHTHLHPTVSAFTDQHSRTLLLRGVNLSGCSKIPIGAPLANTPSFHDVSSVSYVGRPFRDRAHAQQWMQRLSSWGVTLLRVVVVWEALEPRRMGQYDDEYIRYVKDIVDAAGECGIRVIIDGHQDCWSRFSGGSGAPRWTFELVGLEPCAFSECCCAALDAEGAGSSRSSPSGRLWPTNYSKFAVATMFTVFFGGEVFAPRAVYAADGECKEFHGVNVGEVLRVCFTRAYSRLMVELKTCANVMGADPMNEPHPGYIGLPTMKEWNENTELHLGLMPNALESMALAAGVPCKIGRYTRSWPRPSYRTSEELVNEHGRSAWIEGRECIWKNEGVWRIDEKSGNPTVGKKGWGYFARHPSTGETVDFERDLYVPFLRSFHTAMRSAVAGGQAGSWLFVEPVPNLGPPVWPDRERYNTDFPSVSSSSSSTPSNPSLGSISYAPHWYDIRALFEKALRPAITFDVLSLASGSRNLLAHTYFGARGLATNYTKNLQRFGPHLSNFPRGTPLLVGETGVPMDINHQNFYSMSGHKDGAGSVQETMLDALLTALERVNASYALWTFTLNHATIGPSDILCHNDTLAPHQSGDGWNSEDFSITTASGKLRLPRAFPRPYPIATAGVVVSSGFCMHTRRFVVEYLPSQTQNQAEESRTTTVFMPHFHFRERVSVKIYVVADDASVKEHEWIVVGASECVNWDPIAWRWDRGTQRIHIVHHRNVVGRLVVQIQALDIGAAADLGGLRTLGAIFLP